MDTHTKSLVTQEKRTLYKHLKQLQGTIKSVHDIEALYQTLGEGKPLDLYWLIGGAAMGLATKIREHKGGWLLSDAEEEEAFGSLYTTAELLEAEGDSIIHMVLQAKEGNPEINLGPRLFEPLEDALKVVDTDSVKELIKAKEKTR